MLNPQKRIYFAQSQMPMTEASIRSSLIGDVYVSLGEPVGNNGAWTLRVYYKPFVTWIWGGCVLMALGGFVAMSDRRYRVLARREEIAQAIAAHQVVIVSGETGSGKTTQLPKICLTLGRGQKKLIGHTQPRRLAASSVAKRIAQELQTPLGEVVGFKVRFTDHTRPGASVKLMTTASCSPRARPIRCCGRTTRSSSTRRTSDR